MSLLDNIDLPDSPDSVFMHRFDQGENRFRILQEPTTGHVWWPEEGGKPQRVASTTDIPTGAEAKYFWFFPVALGDDIKFLEIKQMTVMQQLKALEGNKEWGDLTQYDVTVTRSGEKLETTYTVVPNPKAQLKDEVADRWAGMLKRYQPDELFNGGSVLMESQENGSSTPDDKESLPF